jgi:glycosyltransferase involved in cell wall biosynthesis
MNRPLHIVHTESSIGWGGQEIRVLEEARGMIGRGHRVTVIAPPESLLVRRAPGFGVPVEPLPIFRRTPRAMIGLARTLHELRPDVINTHSSTDAWLVSLLSLLGRTKAPQVRTRHISAAPTATITSRWLYGVAPSCVVTTGELIRRQVIAVGARPERVVAIPTGIDPRRFGPGDRLAERQRLGVDGRRCIGIVANVRRFKGHRHVLEAVRGLDPEDWQLVVVGDGPSRPELEGLVDSWQIRDRVRFVGDQADVAPWLRAMDLFTLPSIANEGVPQALLQAMMTGLPCINTSAGAIPDVARDGINALVIPPSDPAALEAAVRRLGSEPATAARLGEAARTWALSHATIDGMLDRMERVFRCVVSRGTLHGAT